MDVRQQASALPLDRLLQRCLFPRSNEILKSGSQEAEAEEFYFETCRVPPLRGQGADGGEGDCNRFPAKRGEEDSTSGR